MTTTETTTYTRGQDTFRIGETVEIGPDFSNDGFEKFEAVITSFEDGFIHVRDDENGDTFWMAGNVFKIEPKAESALQSFPCFAYNRAAKVAVIAIVEAVDFASACREMEARHPNTTAGAVRIGYDWPQELREISELNGRPLGARIFFMRGDWEVRPSNYGGFAVVCRSDGAVVHKNRDLDAAIRYAEEVSGTAKAKSAPVSLSLQSWNQGLRLSGFYYAGIDNAKLIGRRNVKHRGERIPKTAPELSVYRDGYRVGIQERKAQKVFGEAASY